MKPEELPELHSGDLIEIKGKESLLPAYFIQLLVDDGKLSIDYTPHILPMPYFQSELRRENVSSLEGITVLTKMKDRTLEEAELIKAYIPEY